MAKIKKKQEASTKQSSALNRKRKQEASHALLVDDSKQTYDLY